MTVDPDFQRELDQFNADQGGPAKVEVAWNAKLSRWQVFAVPVNDSRHPLARNEQTAQLVRPFPDDSGREGVLLFTWAQRNMKTEDIGYLPLDGRLFTALRWADSFQDRDHFKRTIEDPEFKTALESKQQVRDAAYAGASYYFHMDRPLISMNPAIKARADWRHRIR